MKIGILTHHYVKNFGAYMQTKALLSTLYALYPKAEVDIINYRISAHERANNVHFFGLKMKRGDTLTGFIKKIGLFFTYKKFVEALPQSSKVKSSGQINNMGYDLIIIGSDEVWNFKDVAYSPVKFGVDISTPHIAYSASAGGSNINVDDVPPEIGEGLKSFYAISVRDDITEKLVNHFEKKAFRTLDPVFLHQYEFDIRDWIKQIAESEPYILIYDCHLTAFQVRTLTSFAEKNSYKILGAGEYRKWYSTDATTNITPYEWAYLFKNAQMAVTGTFHGVAFSIKYNVPFVAYVTEGNRVNKVESLLNEFGLESRRVVSENDLISVLQADIDFNKADQIMESRIQESLDYLVSNVDRIANKEQK